MDKAFILTMVLFTVLFIEKVIYTVSLKEPEGKILDKFIVQLTLSSYVLTVFVAFGEYVIRPNNSYLLMTAGFMMAMGGVILRRMSIRALGPNWSMYLRDIKNQQIIKTGPYQYLRHPYYLAVSLELLGVVLLFNSRIAFILFCFVHVPLLIKRISMEKIFHNMKFVNR